MDEKDKDEERGLQMIESAMFWQSLIGYGHLIGRIIIFFIIIHFALKYW
jgi:hypothetical protein